MALIIDTLNLVKKSNISIVASDFAPSRSEAAYTSFEPFSIFIALVTVDLLSSAGMLI